MSSPSPSSGSSGSSTPPDWAAQYVGLPFLRCGRTRQGIDCWGLVRLVMAEQYEIYLPAYDGIGWGVNPKADLAAHMAGQAAAAGWVEIPPHQAQAADVVLMRAGGLAIHVGLLVAKGWLLHAEYCADTCLEPLDSPNLSRRIAGFYRYVAQLPPGHLG